MNYEARMLNSMYQITQKRSTADFVYILSFATFETMFETPGVLTLCINYDKCIYR